MDAAKLIIRGTLERRWRILIGDDAHRLDQAIRADPETAYDSKRFDPSGMEGWAKEGSLRVEELATVTAEPAAGTRSRL